MRIVIDLQACQTDSRDRGIGRYAMSLVEAVASELRADDELIIAIDMADARRARDVRIALHRRQVCAKVVSYGYPATAHTDGAAAASRLAGQLRSRFYRALCPDALLTTTFFETGTAYCMELDWAPLHGVATVAIGYDTIPARFPEHYLLPERYFSDWYEKRVRDFRKFDEILAISQATCEDLTVYGGIQKNRITVVDAGFDDALVCTYGTIDGEQRLRALGVFGPYMLMVGNGDWRKNTVGTLGAFASLPERLRNSHQLVLTQVGEDVRQALASKYAHVRKRVRVLGRVDDATLALLYRECKVFYFPSYYEGFGLPVLEAMAFNAPVLSSNAGALPEVVHDRRALFDPNVSGDGAKLLAHALQDEAFREELRRGGREHALEFTWERTAQKALKALRSLVERKRNDAAPAVRAHPWPQKEDIALMAEACIEAGEYGERALEDGLRAIERGGRRRVLVDITEIVRLDAKTGIQRVTRNFFSGLFDVAQERHDFDVEPFAWTEQGIFYARSYAREQLDVACEGEDEVVRAEPSDLVFMLDSSWWSPERFDDFHARVHEVGGEVVWMVYDLIPVRFPETCNPTVPPSFRSWLTHAANTADGFICISEATRHDLHSFMDTAVQPSIRRPWTCSAHLGCDLDAAVSSVPSECRKALWARIGGRPYFIALGTLEPRKNHATILEAFEYLWARDENVALVIVGKQGWNADELVERITQHPERERRLFWLQGVTDGDVRYLLEESVALIQASVWEGFGLPLIEAGSLGVPLIVSDISVFHEIAGDAATYFPVGDAKGLAETVASSSRATLGPTTTGVPHRSWHEASVELASILVRGVGLSSASVAELELGEPLDGALANES